MNRTLLAVTAGLFVLGVAADIVTGTSNFPGYGASIGLFGCIIIIVVYKWLAGIVSRPESFYPDDAPTEADGTQAQGQGQGRAHD